MSDTVKIGRYRHYKGKEYRVIGIGRHTETLEELVIYQAPYDSAEFGPKAIWARPVAMFAGTTVVEGKTVPRFEFLGE